jgi:hypothetical protein
MNTQAQTQNAIAVVTDGFSEGDPTQSPLRGTGIRFKDGAYFAFTDKIDVRGKSYAVLDKRIGWQKLAKDTPPEYLMRTPGQSMPPQPAVDKKDWPTNLNGEPEHPWKLTHYLYLLDVSCGEISTFWSSTVGGRIAIGHLADQVSFMRHARPNAIPVVALEARDFPTGYGGTKPRPHFQILGWRTSGDTDPQLLTSATPLIEVTAPPLAEVLNDSLPDYSAAASAPKKKKNN